MAAQKTNVIRILEQKKIPFTAHEYSHGSEAVDGVSVARLTGVAEEKVFKTLVAKGSGKNVYVFVIPVAMELELRRAAKAVGEKSVEMAHVSEINALTGYIRGGCSPIGMKKLYPTLVHESAAALDTMTVSAGRIGYMVELAPRRLIELIGAKFADIAE